MKLGPIPLHEAEGTLLAHTHHLPDATIRKGAALGPRELEALRQAGIEAPIVARLEPGDVHEDEGARRVAAGAAGDGTRVGRAATGRCNVFAQAAGLTLVDVERVHALNAVDEGIALSCLQPFERVAADALVATVKVIPFALPRAVLERCAELIGNEPLVRLAAFRRQRAALIVTRLPGSREQAVERGAAALAGRLEALGSTLDAVRTVDHRAESVSEAVREAVAAGWAPIFVLGASAIVDRSDVIPLGIEAAGGSVERFGLPVDPGNLLLLARHGDTPVIGMPGCARSPRSSGFDRVLERLLADVPVDADELARMGVGGLMKEIPSRRQPREAIDQPTGEAHPEGAAAAGPPPRRPRVGAVVLAAGRSRRMQGTNKLTQDVGGTPVVARAVDAALASGADPVVVVVGHEAAQVEAALSGRPVRFVHNPRWGEGMGTSVASGVTALADEVEGVLICLGDMPGVDAADLETLIHAFAPERGAAWVPLHRGKRGNPVLWAHRCFAQLRELGGDEGGRRLLAELGEQVVPVPGAGPGVLLDVDTRAALDEVRRGVAPGRPLT